MLAVQKCQNHRGEYVPNVLPCRINHNGPVNASKRYWAPVKTEDDKIVSYFRGRKLYGKRVRVPEGYKGVVVVSSDDVSPEDVASREEKDDEMTEVTIMGERANFEELVVWGHEVLPDDTIDPYVRGMVEWITLAEKVHSYPSKEKDDNLTVPP